MAVLGLLSLMFFLLSAAIAALSPGPPGVRMTVFQRAPIDCSTSLNGAPYSVDAELDNAGGPAWVTLRAYLDGAPALINGVNETITTHVSGPVGGGYAEFTIYAPDCNWHSVSVDIVSVVPA